MEKHIQDRENVEQREKTKALSMVRKVFEDTKQALDVAFSAGVIASKTQNHAQEESLRFSSSLPDSQMRDELSRARKRLKKASTKIDELLNTKYKDEEVPADTNSFFYHWLEDDLNFADKAEGLVRQLEDTIKRSYVLAITKISDPTRLGARPKVYPTLEEEAAPAPERTQDWVHVSKFEEKIILNRKCLSRSCMKKHQNNPTTMSKQ